MQFNNILVICTGNICRSPMAEALLKKALQESGRGSLVVQSAGLAALVGHGADEHAQTLMALDGIDLAAHRGRQLNDAMVHQADLIFVMETAQKQAVESAWPFSRGKVYRIGAWENRDIRDPYGRGKEAFHSAYEDIKRAIRSWLQRLP